MPATNVVFLHSAERDLLELRDYVGKNFGRIAWRTSYKQINHAVIRLKTFPLEGYVPDELASLNVTQYRQVVAGMNRVIYEVRGQMLYIHIVCDTRKDMLSLLTRRLLRAD